MDLVGKTKGKRPLGITRRRWEVNIKKDLQHKQRFMMPQFI
jgi:hypothetical protein